MLRYQNNAFRILGLKPSASMKEIVHHVNEIKVKKSLGMDVAYEYDFPWMGPIDRSEQNVINALQQLENPITRLMEEIFWFWFDTDCDKRAINYLIQNNRQAAHNTWKTLLTSNTFDEKSISAYMNQTILAHSSVIGLEKKKRNIKLNETHWKNWRFAINRFTSITSEENFWTIVNKKAKRINDPRLSTMKVDEICDNFLQDIAKPNFMFTSQALGLKDYEKTKQHSGLLNGSAFPSDVLRKGFNRVLTSHIDSLKRHSQIASNELLKIGRDAKGSDKDICNLYYKLVSNITDILYEGNLVDINTVSDFALAKDDLADVIRDSAIALNNILASDHSLSQEDTEVGHVCAYEMIKKALEYAGSIYTKQKFAKDKEIVKRNMEMERLSRSYYEQVSSTQSTSDSKGHKEPVKSPSSSNWKYIIGWVVFFGFIIFMVSLSDDTTNNKSSSSSTSSYSSKKSTTSSTYQLKTRIDELAKSIKEKEAKLLVLKSSMKSKNEDMKRLKREAGSLKTRHNEAKFRKDKIANEYNEVINSHNSILESYQKDYSAYQSLYSKYERDLNTRNKLVKEYNKKIQ